MKNSRLNRLKIASNNYKKLRKSGYSSEEANKLKFHFDEIDRLVKNKLARENYKRLRDAGYSWKFAKTHAKESLKTVEKHIVKLRQKAEVSKKKKVEVSKKTKAEINRLSRENYRRLRDAGYSREFARRHAKESITTVEKHIEKLRRKEIPSEEIEKPKKKLTECERYLDYSSLDDMILSFLSYIADKSDVSFPVSIEHFIDNKPGYHFKFEYKNKYGDMDNITVKTYDLSFPVSSFLFDLYESALNIILDSTKCMQDYTGLSDSDCTLNADDICTLKITEMTVPDQQTYELAMRWKYGRK